MIQDTSIGRLFASGSAIARRLPACIEVDMGNLPSDAKARLLLVEDDDALRELMCSELEAAGYLVDAHGSAEDALRSLPLKARVAVLDYRLPGIDGLELVRRLKDSYPDLKVLMVTSEAADFAKRASSRSGVSAIIRKPFKFVRLLEALHAVAPSR